MARKKSSQKKDIDYFGFDIYEMSFPDLKKYVKKKSESANKQLLRIEQAGIYSWAYGRTMREMGEGRKRFRYGYKTREQLIGELRLIEAFNAQESSKVSNLRHVQTKAYQKLRERILKEKKIDIADIKDFDQNTFYKFLNSRQGKDMLAKYTSDDVVDDIIEQMYERKVKLEDVVKDYKDFLTSEIPFNILKDIVRARTPERANELLERYMWGDFLE